MKKRKKTEQVVVPPLPAHEAALAALKNLSSKDYIKTGKVREYYFELSNIVRHYVEDRFQVRAPEMTTEEFLNTLHGSNILNTGQKVILKEFLHHCDMVKFAKYMPEPSENEASYASARNFIEETKEVTKSEEVRK